MGEVMDNVEMHEIAVACSRLTEMVRHSVNDSRIRDPDSRQRVAQALLAAAIDHAVSITYLLSHPSPSLVFSAIGVFRMQLDALCRGIFFARKEFSTDAEIADFLASDRMPLVKPLGEKKKRQIMLEELIAKLRDFLASEHPKLAEQGLHHRFDYALRKFNGYVHGGNEVVEAYQEHAELGMVFIPDFNALANIALHATTLSIIAEMTQLFFVSGNEHATFPNGEARMRVYQAFIEAGKKVRPP